jgi:hypothetical protein
MTSEELMAAKARVQEQYLGKAGIHAVGASVARQSIRLYTQAPEDLEKEGLLDEIRRLAAPFEVTTVKEQPPRVR